MTREIKFRAWNKVWGMMSLVDKIEFEEGKPVSVSVTIKATDFDHTDEWSDYEVGDDIILQQYTGLKDKNGKEIFEGDIMGEVLGGLYVKWCDKCKQFQLHILNLNECMACGGDLHWSEFVTFDDNEVIGNIYENKELVREYL